MRLAAALLLLALLAPAARGQAPPAPPPAGGAKRQLAELEAEVEATRRGFTAAVEGRLEVQAEYLNLKQERVGLLSEQLGLERQPRSVTRDAALQELRARLGAVGARLAERTRQLEDAQAEEAVRRIAAIRALDALAERLFEKADEAPRPLDRDRHLAAAADALQRAERYRQRPVEPAEDDPVPLDDPAALPTERLASEVEIFVEFAERAEDRVRELEPDRAQLERNARHLERWRERVPNPDLPVRLERAREELRRIAELIEHERARAAGYRAHVQALERERARRAQGAEEEPR